MGTPKKNALDEISSESSRVRGDHTDTRGNDVDAAQEESRSSNLAEQVEKRVVADTKEQLSPPDQKEGVPAATCKEASDDGGRNIPRDGSQLSKSDHHNTPLDIKKEEKEQESQNPETGGDHSQDKPRNPVSVIRTSDAQQTQSPDTKTPTSGSYKTPSIVTAKDETNSDALPQIQSPNAGSLSSQSNQVTLAYYVGSEKSLDKLQPRRNPDTVVQLSQSNQGSSSFITPEKPSEDGYNWRKYGQKLVKGNEFIRSYYKCTYPNCVAKKQVERSNAGQITDINYLGKHEHPKPQHAPQTSAAFVQPPQVVKQDTHIVSISEADKPSAARVETAQHESTEVIIPLGTVASESVGGGTSDVVENTPSQDLKRQKRDISATDDPMLSKHGSEVRHVVQTRSEVDLVNDGYRWRKYGQKLVKGNPNPRSYYRCSNAGCQVKKHVERACHDPKLVITTYEGKHDHEMPGSRTVTHNASGGDATITAMMGESRSEAGESKPNGLDMAVHIGAN